MAIDSATLRPIDRLFRSVHGAVLGRLLGVVCGLVASLPAQSPSSYLVLPPEPLLLDPTAAGPEDHAERRWFLAAAGDALAMGLPTLATSLFRQFEEAFSLAVIRSEGYGLDYVDALIASGSEESARQRLAQLALDGDLPRIRRAFLHLRAGQDERARQELRAIDLGALGAPDLVWVFLIEAWLAEREGDFERAASSLRHSRELDLPVQLSLRIELLQWRYELLRSPLTEDQMAGLRMTMRTHAGQRVGLEAARLLAIALARSNRKDEAIALIDEQLRFAGVLEDDLRSSFLLLISRISGESSGRGRLALRELLRSSRDLPSLQLGIRLLAAGAIGNPELEAGLSEFVEELISREASHPMADHLLAVRARIHLANRSHSLAEADANRLLNTYPGSVLREEAVRLLAYVAWQRQPPQFRTAAGFLGRIRTDMPPGPERARIGRLMGDCYFLNQDFASAAEVYGSIWRETPPPERGTLLYQRVLAEIRAQRLAQAESILDRDGPETQDHDALWRAEWNLALALRDVGRVDQALQRISRRFSGQDAGSALPPELRLRLGWLQARLALDAGRPESVPGLTEFLQASIPDAALDEGMKRLVGASTAFLLAESLLALGQSEQALTRLAAVRHDFPDTPYAALSYLLEARHEAAAGNLVLAQRRFIQMADEFPKSPYAPVARWEAAVLAEQRGLVDTYREAATILEGLVQNHPSSPMVFHARLKQGDLSRRLNDFGAALLLYEDVLLRFPNHPERFRAEIARADSLAAMAEANPSRLEDALLVYERLADLPSLHPDMRAEALFKWGFALARRGQVERASGVLWLAVDRYLVGTPAPPPDRGVASPTEPSSLAANPSLGPQGRHWVARALLELGSLLEAGRDFTAAREVLNLLVAGGLPGRDLALERLRRLDRSSP